MRDLSGDKAKINFDACLNIDGIKVVERPEGEFAEAIMSLTLAEHIELLLSRLLMCCRERGSNKTWVSVGMQSGKDRNIVVHVTVNGPVIAQPDLAYNFASLPNSLEGIHASVAMDLHGSLVVKEVKAGTWFTFVIPVGAA